MLAAASSRLLDLDQLEAPLERRVLLDVLLVLRPRRGGHGAQLAARQCRLEQIRGVAGAGRPSGADQGVRLVDEQDDRLGRLAHFADHRFEPVLELAFAASARLEQAEVETADLDVAQRLGHVAVDDAQRQALDDRGLPHPGLAHQDRVVLAPSHQHVDHGADLGVAPEHRVDAAGARPSGEIERVEVERGLARLARRAPCRRPGAAAARVHRVLPGSRHRRHEVLAQVVGRDLAKRLEVRHAAEPRRLQRRLDQHAAADRGQLVLHRGQHPACSISSSNSGENAGLPALPVFSTSSSPCSSFQNSATSTS